MKALSTVPAKKEISARPRRSSVELAQIDLLAEDFDHLRSNLLLLNMASESMSLDDPFKSALAIFTDDSITRLKRIQEFTDGQTVPAQEVRS